MPRPAIIVHGGAYNILDSAVAANLEGVSRAVKVGYEALLSGADSTAAVVAAITELEDDITFDAGHGSVLNVDGEVEMDCLLMEGSELQAVSMMCANKICNPIQVANHLLHNQEDDRVVLLGAAAETYADSHSLATSTMSKLITDEAISEWRRLTKYSATIHDVFRARENKPSDTVGCVALDSYGNISCGTSTGGITAKMVGRVGDSPLVGCGGYADSFIGGVSTTGHGEAITKATLAYRVIQLMNQGLTPDNAARAAVMEMDALVAEGHGGVICLDKHGNLGLYFNTPRMAWATMKDNLLICGINSGDHPNTAVSKAITIPIPPSLLPMVSEPEYRVVIVGTRSLLDGQEDGLLRSKIHNMMSNCDDVATTASAILEAIESLGSGYYSSLVMEGVNHSAATALSVTSKHSPSSLANLIRLKTCHTLMCGEGAERVAHIHQMAPRTATARTSADEWISAVLLMHHGRVACAVTERLTDSGQSVMSIGCRAYADTKGTAVAFADPWVSSRVVAAKDVCVHLQEGINCEEAVKRSQMAVNARIPDNNLFLAAMDHHGMTALSRELEEDTAEYTMISFRPQ